MSTKGAMGRAGMATMAVCLALMCRLPVADGWVSVSPSGDVSIRDHTEIGYWDSTASAKDLKVTGSQYVRGNMTLTNGTSIHSDYVMMLSSGVSHDILLRPGAGGKIDLGSVLVDADSFSLNTTTSRIYTKQNLTLSPGPALGDGGHVKVEQPRGTAFLDLASQDDSTASGAQINLRNSGARRVGAGEYTIAVTEDGAFAITTGRPATSKLAQFETGEVVEIVVEQVYSFNISYNSTYYFCGSAEWYGWSEALALNETWLMLNDSTFVTGVIAAANQTQNVSAIALNLTNDSNGSNGSNGSNLTANATDVWTSLLESFFYNFENRTFFCLEKGNTTDVGSAEAIVNWVADTTPSAAALAMFQLHFANNVTIPRYGSTEEVEELRRRRLEETESLVEGDDAVVVSHLLGGMHVDAGALNTSSWGTPSTTTADYVQDVYNSIEADVEEHILTISRERGTVISGSLTADNFTVNSRAAIGDLVVEGSNVSSADDIRITPGSGKVVVDAITVDDSTITSQDPDVPLTLASPAGILLDTDGDVSTVASGSVLVTADAVDWNVVSTVRATAADYIGQFHDTITVNTGEVASMTSGRVELNALDAVETSMGDLLVGVGRSAEISVLDAVDVTVTNMTGSVGAVVDLSALDSAKLTTPIVQIESTDYVNVSTPNLEINAVGSIKASAGELLQLETRDAVSRTGRDSATSVGEQLNLTSTVMNAAAAHSMRLDSGGSVDLSADTLATVVLSGIDVSSTDLTIMLNRTLDISAVHEIALETTTLFIDTAQDVKQTVGRAFELVANSEIALSSGGTLDAFAAGAATLAAGEFGVLSGGAFNLTAASLGIGIESNISISARESIELATGNANVMVDSTLQLAVGGDALLNAASATVKSSSSLEAIAADLISAQATAVKVSAVEGLQLDARTLTADLVGDVDVSAGGTTRLTSVDAELNAYGSVTAAAVRDVSVSADSLRLDAVEAIDLSTARLSVDAGRTLDAYAAETMTVRGRDIATHAEDTLKVFAGRSIVTTTEQVTLRAAQSARLLTDHAEVTATDSLAISAATASVSSTQMGVDVGDTLRVAAGSAVNLTAGAVDVKSASTLRSYAKTTELVTDELLIASQNRIDVTTADVAVR